MKKTDTIANMETAARKLTGRNVTIRIREPLNTHARGETYNAGSGRVVVDLAPEVFNDLRGFIRTFTHELAHVKLHAAAAPVVDVDRKPGAVKVSAAVMTLATKAQKFSQRESEAEALADTWRKAIYSQYFIPADCPISDRDFIRMLRILYTYTGV